MKSGMYTEGAGQQKTNSREAKDFRDAERTDEVGGKFTGHHPEGHVPSGKPYPLPELIAGSRVPVAILLCPQMNHQKSKGSIQD